MMSNQWQARRGTTAQNDAFTGASGEITYDTESQGLRVHDGTKQGGYLVDTVVDFQKPTAENNYTWYRLYASGFVEQGGLTATITDTTVNLPVEMADTNYSIIATSYKADAGSSGASNNGLTVGQRTTTTFFIVLQEQRAYFWQVSGMAA
ncbi:MAG: hypothetical protein UHM08_09120 [Bacteroidales bacterium]|nr:hypothetical protein [Bacteroidales bacterium]